MASTFDLDIELKWEAGAQNKLLTHPDLIVYSIARQTLDEVLPHIPYDTKTMRNITAANGVRGGDGQYYLLSSTSYASTVYAKPQSGTHWTNPESYAHWFDTVWQRRGKIITDTQIERNKLQ